MCDGLLARPLVPVADVDDAEATYNALVGHVDPTDTQPVVIHVRTETKSQRGTAAVARFESLATDDTMTVESQLRDGDDITDTLLRAAGDVDASAVVFCSRGGSAWFDLLVGGVRTSLLAKSDSPVVLLPTESA